MKSFEEQSRRPDPFQFTDPRSFLRSALEFRKKRNPQFSSRAWARQMKFKSHVLLTYFLTGRRKIRPHHLSHILKGLDLSEQERRYFEALVHFKAARTTDEKVHYESQLRECDIG